MEEMADKTMVDLRHPEEVGRTLLTDLNTRMGELIEKMDKQEMYDTGYMRDIQNIWDTLEEEYANPFADGDPDMATYEAFLEGSLEQTEKMLDELDAICEKDSDAEAEEAVTAEIAALAEAASQYDDEGEKIADVLEQFYRDPKHDIENDFEVDESGQQIQFIGEDLDDEVDAESGDDYDPEFEAKETGDEYGEEDHLETPEQAEEREKVEAEKAQQEGGKLSKAEMEAAGIEVTEGEADVTTETTGDVAEGAVKASVSKPKKTKAIDNKIDYNEAATVDPSEVDLGFDVFGSRELQRASNENLSNL